MSTEDRAARLLRWYPASWRARYGAEFTELLLADLAERPRCRRRTTDVALRGVLARLRCAGLSGQLPDPADQARACLAVLAGAATLFLILGTTAWSQLVTGWQWAAPGARAVRAAVVIMSASLLLMLVLAVLAAAPGCWYLARAVLARGAVSRAAVGRGAVGRGAVGRGAVGRGAVGRGAVDRVGGDRVGRAGPRWARPAAVAALGGLVLAAGARHFANGWPGTGGHPWPQQGLVPGGVAAFGWAATLSVTSYWAHPAALLAFPASEIAWMVVSPVALACLAAGLVITVRRLDLPGGTLRYQARLGCAAAAAMALFLAGAACWVLSADPGPGTLFRAGSIDVAALAGMALALVAAWHAAYRARSAALAWRAPGARR